MTNFVERLRRKQRKKAWRTCFLQQGRMYSADYTSEPRDSGSAIYVSTAHNESALVGIHQGRSTYNEAYIVQAQYINETFNISCY